MDETDDGWMRRTLHRCCGWGAFLLGSARIGTSVRARRSCHSAALVAAWAGGGCSGKARHGRVCVCRLVQLTAALRASTSLDELIAGLDVPTVCLTA